MVKTQIQLEEWQYDAVKRASASNDRSMSDIIREGVLLYLAKTKRHGAPLAELAGKYRPKPVTGLKSHDREWVEAIR